MGDEDRKLLFEPIAIGGIEAPNRVVMLPMGSGMPGEDGHANAETIAYYRRRAQGGVGLLTVEASLVAPGPSAIGPELRLHDDRFVPDLARLVDAVHAEGVPIGIQLWHPGRQTNLGEPVAPSPVPLSPRTPVPRELTREDIGELIGQYAAAAGRCRAAGFDYVEVHAGHCYLPCEFLSPLVNQRTDEYGGDLAGRARFLLEIVAAARDACGADYPVFCRITGSDAEAGGFEVDEAVQVARWLEAAGVACLSVTAGTWHTIHLSIPPMSVERGVLLPFAERVKAAVEVPVIAAGRLDSPALAEEALAAGQADLIGVGRGLIADPDWARKVRAGQVGEITPCIACNACLDLISRAEQVRCAVNPEVGRELGWALEPAAPPRRVMVIGGGPSGLEAARVARARGHEVSLWDRATRLGGKLDVASRAPSKHEVLRFRDHEEEVMDALGVDVRLGVEVGAEAIAEVDPDVVVIATGAAPLVPPIPGVDGPQVLDAQRLLLGEEAVRPGERVTVIGGSATGCETAELLAGAGCEVAIVEMLPSVGRGIELVTRKRLLRGLREAGVTILTGCKVVAIEAGRVVYEREDGTVEHRAADRVALAIGWVPRGAEIAAALDGRRHLVVGDAERPADFVAAINAGADAGLRIERI